MRNTPQPTEYVSKPVTVVAMQWVPGDLVQAGPLIGWLLASGVSFNHPSGSGETTTLHIAGDYKPLQPSGWVLKRGDGKFYTLTDDQFRAAYEVPSITRPNSGDAP